MELLCDIDQINFVERGMRGGISQICHRYARANNSLLGEEEYDPNQPTQFIQLFDINNLYGAAQTNLLPTGMFHFLNANEIEKLDILSLSDDSPTGMIVEVDLRVPERVT